MPLTDKTPDVLAKTIADIAKHYPCPLPARDLEIEVLQAHAREAVDWAWCIMIRADKMAKLKTT